jgi:hypothetical protein
MGSGALLVFLTLITPKRAPDPYSRRPMTTISVFKPQLFPAVPAFETWR